VQDVIGEICDRIGVESKNEREEFSLYCIAAADDDGEKTRPTSEMPLMKGRYVLNVVAGTFLKCS